jgi:hypothetical protein
MLYIRKFSISSGKSYFAANHWVHAFAGMTGIYTQLSFPQRREPRYPGAKMTFYEFIKFGRKIK